MVWHQAHGYEGNKLSFDKSYNEHQKNIYQKINLCPIGEYKFFVNDLPNKTIPNFIVPAVKHVQKEIVKQQLYKQVFSEKSPRAPPFLIS